MERRELFDDLESLSGLTLDPARPAFSDKKSFVATYRFEPQDTKLKEGDTVKIALTLEPAGTLVELDVEQGRAVLRRQAKSGDFPATCSLIPGKLIKQDVLVAAVAAFAKRVSIGGSDADQALIGLLERRLPRISGLAPGQPVVAPGAPSLNAAIDAVQHLDASHLVIQGPPGTGKTFTTSHAILALLKAGKRVAVSSNSHKAINNLLEAVEQRANEVSFTFEGVKKASAGSSDSFFQGRCVSNVLSSSDVTADHRLVGATAFHFAQPAELGAYDYLFVDEAGQVALGNLVAMGGCARSIVLVGDQMQLPQPVQGVHPGESGLSCLEYLMEGSATVPPELGILLDVSWRMHPAVCGFISDAIYDGRLKSHPSAAERRLVLDGARHSCLRPVGLSVVEVDHAGCAQASPEEAQAIAEIVGSLLTQCLRGDAGSTRQIRLDDVLVVAPFNAQVNLLRRYLPAGARVGTVDKFQGQEAAVAIISMATSNGAEAPRGSEFLFNLNRLNVAISRAQCLAILVRSRHLLDLSPGSVADLERLDAFARADSVASAQVADLELP